MTPGQVKNGYATLAAVLTIGIFAALALSIITATRVSLAEGGGDLTRARAAAAADAGIAIVLHRLLAGDDAGLALLGGQPLAIEFDGARLTARVTDERGKIPINHVEDATITRMLEQAGLSGDTLETARDSLLDWIDDDDQPRGRGAEIADYGSLGLAPRNGALLSVDELGRVRGFSPALVNVLRTYVTVDPEAQPFDPTHAQPRAIAAMTEAGDLSPTTIEREREASGQQVALGSANPKDLLHRPMTISVDADVDGNGHAHRDVVVVLTGQASDPWHIHALH